MICVNEMVPGNIFAKMMGLTSYSDDWNGNKKLATNLVASFLL